MHRIDPHSTIFYQVGFALLAFLSFIVFLSTFFFILGTTILKFTVLLAAACVCVLIWRTSALNQRECVAVICTVLLVILICATASTFVYDLSYDGNTYHKTTIGMLANGWNPVYQSFEAAATRSGIIPEFNWPIWYDHYPKASWIIGASFYALTGNIETGKCMNAIMMICVFCLLVSTLQRHHLLPGWKGYLFALLAVFNPITIPQMQSYYIDGMMQMLLYAALISLLDITFTKEEKPAPQNWFILFFAINLALNIKYSGLVFMAIYCGAFYCYWLIRDFRENRQAFKSHFLKLTGFYAGSVGCAVCFTGATSYLRNVLQHHNLLYTMIGQDKIEIISTILPDSYAGKPYFIQFLLSLFSQTSNIGTGSGMEPSLKLPFTVTLEQLKMGSFFDARISAWGIFFSGIFLLSLVFLVPIMVTLFRRRKSDGGIFAVTVLVLSATLIQAFFLPGLAMARYYAHLFLFPLFALGYALYCLDTSPKKKLPGLCAFALILLLTLNLSNYAAYALVRINQSQDMRMELKGLSALSEKAAVTVSLQGGECMQGYLFNLNDAGVHYTVDPALENGTTIFHWQIMYQTE